MGYLRTLEDTVRRHLKSSEDKDRLEIKDLKYRVDMLGCILDSTRKVIPEELVLRLRKLITQVREQISDMNVS